MKDILIIQGSIPHYRVELFNSLSKKHHVSVLHSGDYVGGDNILFNQIVVNKYSFGPFIFQPYLIKVLRKNYDVIISMFDIRWPLNYIPLLNKKCVVWWGGWLTNNEIANKIKVFLMKKNIKSILYSEFHKEQFISLGVPKSNMIVANNSIHISNRLKSFLHKKKTIVFSGSFNKRKKLDKLIDIFNECLKLIPKKITLILVGDGLIFDEIKDKIISLNLEDRIKLYGKITNSRDLSKIYKSAFCSVSYGQAGLSVLQSLGFGVPFICPNDAISGGEIYNIKSGHNGFLTVSDDDFKNKIIEICNNEDYAIKLGKNAFNYYTSECTIKNMSQKFFEIISDLK